MKTLIGIIQSEANQDCQSEWIENLKKLKGEFEVLIVENSYDDGNFNYLKTCFKHVLKGPYFNTIKERIIENRNAVLDWFRAHKEYDNLLFLDSDIFPPSSTIEELMNSNKDIVGSVCWITGKANTFRVAWNFFKKYVENGKSEDCMEGIKENKKYIREDGEVVEVPQVGLGCTLFNGDMLRKEKDVRFRENGIMLNEDFTFIDDLRKKGYDAYLNMKVNCFHHLAKFQRGGGIYG